MNPLHHAIHTSTRDALPNTAEPGLPSIGAAQLQQLLAHHAAPSGALGARGSLAGLLLRHGYHAELKDISLSEADAGLKGFDLSGMRFESCRFEWNHLSEAFMHAGRFEGCHFVNTAFVRSHLVDCEFIDCHFHEAMLVNANLNRVRFAGGAIDAS